MKLTINDILKSSSEYLKFFKNNYEIDLYKSDIREAEPVIIYEQVHSGSTKNFAVKEGSVVRKEEWKSVKTVAELDEKINKCKKCELHKTRKNFVFGTGNPNAKVAVIGEAPGADEDVQGKPFVGRAGKLLTDILKAINFERDEVFICNILKCRPPGNRNPLPDEIEKCEPYLHKQLKLINPDFILCVGAYAAQTLLKMKEPLGKMRGKIFDYKLDEKIIKTVITYHPAALLRNPNWKKPTWEDVQLFRKEYDKMYKQ